jgi:putative ABC transport system permease protein
MAGKILSEYPQTDVVVLTDMMQRMSAQLNNIKGLAYGIEALLWAVSVLIIALIFILTSNERQREFRLLLALGATRSKLKCLLLSEAMIISIIGAFSGVTASCFLMYEFRMLIAVSLGLPYLQPDIGSTALTAAVSVLMSVSTALSACLYSVIRIGRVENYCMIREHD